MIKRIACFCTIKPSEGSQTYAEQVFGIYDTARVFNKEHGIVGVFVVHGAVLLQVLEGDSNSIAKALYQVNRDPRVQDVSIILNHSYESPAFSRWSIKMIKGERDAHNDYMTRLKCLLAPHAALQSAQDHTRFQALFGATNLADNNVLTEATSTDDEPDFHNHTLAMTAWPRPTRLRLNAPLMRLCQILIGHTLPYQRLVALKLFESEAEMNEQLRALYRANALEVFKVGGNNNVESLTPNKTSATLSDAQPARERRFSQALKHFIQGQREKGFGSQ